MLVYNSAVFAVAQTNVFLLFGLLFPLPVTLFAFFIFKKKTCYLSFQLSWLFSEEDSHAASQKQTFHLTGVY